MYVHAPPYEACYKSQITGTTSFRRVYPQTTLQRHTMPANNQQSFLQPTTAHSAPQPNSQSSGIMRWQKSPARALYLQDEDSPSTASSSQGDVNMSSGNYTTRTLHADDDVIYQVEVNSTGVETYATSTSVQIPQVSSAEYNLRQRRRPPPSPQSAGMMLSSSADRPGISGFMTGSKQIPGHFRTLTPPSGVFSSNLSTTPSIHHTNTGMTGGRARTSHNSNDNLNSNDGLSQGPPPKLATSGVLSPSPSKVVLRPYVFRPVPLSKSSGHLHQDTTGPLHQHPASSFSTGPTSPRGPVTTAQNQAFLPSYEQHQQYRHSQVDDDELLAAGERRHSVVRGTPSYDPLDPSAPPSRSVSRTGGSRGAVSSSRQSVNSNPADLETQLRWRETELKQLRATMERNENAMTQVFEERLASFERQLNLERQKSSRLELTLAAGRKVEKDVTVQTSFSGVHSKLQESHNDSRLHQQLLDQSEEFHVERTRWLEEKAKVIAYQRQLQLNYVQLTRKTQRLESDLEQATLELEHKNQQLLLVEGFNQLEVASVQRHSFQQKQQQQLYNNHGNSVMLLPDPVYPSSMRRSASSEPSGKHGRSPFLHLEPEETAC